MGWVFRSRRICFWFCFLFFPPLSVTGLNVFQQPIRYRYSHGKEIVNGSRLFCGQVLHSCPVKCMDFSPNIASCSGVLVNLETEMMEVILKTPKTHRVLTETQHAWYYGHPHQFQALKTLRSYSISSPTQQNLGLTPPCASFPFQVACSAVSVARSILRRGWGSLGGPWGRRVFWSWSITGLRLSSSSWSCWAVEPWWVAFRSSRGDLGTLCRKLGVKGNCDGSYLANNRSALW